MTALCQILESETKSPAGFVGNRLGTIVAAIPRPTGFGYAQKVLAYYGPYILVRIPDFQQCLCNQWQALRFNEF